MAVKKRFKAKKVAPYLFCLPFFIAVIVVYLYPFANTILMSFQSVKLMGQSKFVGLSNYKNLWNAQFITAVKNSLIFTFFFVLIQIPFSLALALALNRKQCWFRNFFKSALFVPILASTVIAGVLFRLIFASSDEALLNSVLIRLGVIKEGVSWLYSSKANGIIVLVLVALWRNTGINIVFCLSGLQNVSPDLYDAARTDGAGAWNMFRYVTLPGIRPTLIYILTMSVMTGLSMFSESYVLWRDTTVNGTGITIVRYLYEMGFYKGNFGMASAVGIVLLCIVLGVNLLQLRAAGLFRED